ncbi:hypothetical protein AB1Y20_010233 [Prymnesium parvum]|uniref:RanBP2-type domain-containing protein n=1 Tax=Prymnesium parvum TaxID=97485 RepID=A0AB34K7E3_PRYPA
MWGGMPGMGMPRGGGGGRSGPPQEGVDGNWKCTSCGNINFVQRHGCNRCGTAKPPPEQLQAREMELMMGVAPAGGMPRGAPVEGVNGNWRCTSCSNVNWEQRDVCHRCQTPKPPAEFLMHRQMEVANATAMMAMHGKMPGKGPVEGLDGNWRCLNCHEVNWAQREECHRCKAGRNGGVGCGAGMMGAGMMGYVDPTTGQMYGVGPDGQMMPSAGGGRGLGGAPPSTAASGEGEVAELRQRCATLEQQMMSVQTTLAPQVMQMSAALQQLQMLVTQLQSQMIANLEAAAHAGGGAVAAPAPAAATVAPEVGEKRKADAPAESEEEEAKRQA